MNNPRNILKRYFGYDSFRPNQQQVVDAVLAGRDCLAVMPTGAGKSLCYQVPALCLGGYALVVSPLIALMEDQVGALRQNGVAAAYINSSQTSAQQREVLALAAKGAYRLLYVAPERLHAQNFREFAAEHAPNLVAIDEAHCISQWGQDFRPSYTRINAFVAALPTRPPVCALTATATQRVREDILAELALHDPLVLVSTFDRPNLHFETRNFAGKAGSARDKALLSAIKKHACTSAIVYCSTRAAVEEVCDYLCGNGVKAVRYHAGLPDKERKRSQEDFVYDRAPVIVATNAFGMGIDKSNVGLVVHYNMPLDLESYYQEAGRAGRDGSPATCLLLYAPKDVGMARFLLSSGLQETAEIDGPTLRDLRERAEERLKQMTFYATTTDCLRGFILRYFGETPPGYCGNCSSCTTQFETKDVTEAAQKIVSCVFRLAQRNRTVGKTTIVGILRGSRAEKILDQRYDTLSTYGIMEDVPAREVRYILDALIERGLLETTLGDYPVVCATQAGADWLRSGEALELKVPKPAPTDRDRDRLAGRGWAGGKGSGQGDAFDASSVPVDPDLFQKLRELRARLASEEGVPAYIVFSDKTLGDMCRRAPKTLDDLLDVNGVGQVKAARYGQAFLDAING